MALDPVLAGGVRLPNFGSPLEHYTNALNAQEMMQQNQVRQNQLTEYDRALANQNALNEIIRENWNPQTNQLNRPDAYSALAARSQGHQIQALEDARIKQEKETAATRKLGAEADEIGIKAYVSRMGEFRQQLAGLSPDNDIGMKQVIASLYNDPMTQQFGAVPMEAVFADIDNAKANGTLARWQQQYVNSAKDFQDQVLEAEKLALEQTKQTSQVVPLGDRVEVVSTDLYGKNPESKVTHSGKVGTSPNRPQQTTNIIMPKVETEYGKAFAGELGKEDAALRSAARVAPDLASRADRILDLLDDGNIITGAGADIRLQLGKALNLAGAKNEEIIANTEVLVADLANNTLAAIKTSGLGSGQGFTNQDREFLEKAVGGKITLSKESIRRLTELARKAAERSAATWETRRKAIPASATQGTGIENESYVVPKRRRAVGTSNGPQVGTVRNGYRFKGGDPNDELSWEKVK